jgi:hypothetical protein
MPAEEDPSLEEQEWPERWSAPDNPDDRTYQPAHGPDEPDRPPVGPSSLAVPPPSRSPSADTDTGEQALAEPEE